MCFTFILIFSFLFLYAASRALCPYAGNAPDDTAMSGGFFFPPLVCLSFLVRFYLLVKKCKRYRLLTLLQDSRHHITPGCSRNIADINLLFLRNQTGQMSALSFRTIITYSCRIGMKEPLYLILSEKQLCWALIMIFSSVPGFIISDSIL